MAPLPIHLPKINADISIMKALPQSKHHHHRLHHLPVHLPKFLTSPQSKVAKEGDNVKLEFTVLWSKSDVNMTKTIWEKDRKVLYSKACPRIKTTEHEELRCLEICDLKPSDAGVYQISVINSNGQSERCVRLDVIGHSSKRRRDKMRPLCCSSSSGIVESADEGGQSGRGNLLTRIPKELISMNNRVVKNPPPPPTILQHLSSFTCIEGEKIELVTKIKGAEKVVWVKNDQLIENSPYFKYIHDQSQELYKLVIKDVFTQDSGLYICEAYNQSGGSITFATITVKDTPIKKSGDKKNENSLQGFKRLIMEKVNQNRQKTEQNRTERSSSKPEPEVSDSIEFMTIMNGKLKCGDELDGCEVTHDVHFEKIENSNTNGRISPATQTPILSSSPIVSQNVTTKLNKKSDSIDTKTLPENSKSVSSISIDESTFFQTVANDTVGSIIDSAEQPALLAEVEVYDTPSKTATHQFEEAGKYDFQNEEDPRHDSGIIAGIEVSDNEKVTEEEHFSEIDLSPLSQSQPLTSHVLSLREDNLRKTPSVMGPTYLIAMKDELVFIRVKYSGVPQARVQWTKSGKVCEDIVENSELSSVRIEKVSYDDSGRYVARISNDHGTILHYCFLAVEGPPEPPSTSPTTLYNDTTGSISISWSGSPYDGGSIITGYIVQINIDEKEWTDLSVVNWLTYSFTTPTLGTSYQFRIHCKNMYGVGPPSGASAPISLPMSSDVSLDDEQQILGHFEVQIRRGSLQNFYMKGEELGKGRFGVVFSAKDKDSGVEFAGKIVRCIKAADKVKVRQEVEIMNILRHQKLLQIMDAMENDKEICIITEKINGGELFERVVADDFTLTEFDCVGFMRQICDGVRFMHLKNIIHLDLKPENILCLTRSTYNIKIIDFGLSQKYESAIPLRVLFGTPEFIAPEIINYEPISPASDMWALGVITYVLLSGLSPFMGESDSETFSNITQGIFDFDDEAFDHISDDAKDFISTLLIRRQEKRLTATDCLAHKWLAYPEPKKNTVIPTDKLKRFIIRRKWQKTGNAIRALGRMANLYSSRKSGSVDFVSSGNRKSEDSGTENVKTRECSSLEEESEDEKQIERKRQLLQRQQRVDSSSI